MRFTDIDVKFDIKYEGLQNWSKIDLLSMLVLQVFSYHHMWHQNWHQYVWTSLCQFFLWTSSMVKIFDFLTFGIFLTTWHHLTFCCPITCVPHYSWNRGDGTYGQCGMCPSRSTWSRVMRHMSTRGRVIRHMGDGEQEWWGMWEMWHVPF